jgi:hypothetical protein
VDYASYQSKNETGEAVARMGEIIEAYRVLVENLTKEATWET